MNTIKPTLVILAAGIGSRYGGLKQLDSFTPEGDTILDFSIYDALQAGFGKFVFIIRKNIEADFKAIFDKKLIGKAEVAYVFQETENIPEKFKPNKREKPWGTGHALLMAKEVVHENFAIINADDFYGREAFEIMAKSLQETPQDSTQFNMIAYQLKNTISEHGFVSRGECVVNKEGLLTDVTERTHIEKIASELFRKDENGELIPIDENTIVSMNFWGFTHKCFDYAETLFENFLEKNHDAPKSEFFIPLIVNEMIKEKKASVQVLKSSSLWFGVTYKEDKAVVQSAIETLKNHKIYPINLW
ncbi:MAG: nucleotide-diphospho-sugar transferase [Flavobacteriaceae bacterium]|nr:MAG: nucleotide-diphospho-sugar transferase [Flavobacteriaceae bacterium]